MLKLDWGVGNGGKISSVEEVVTGEEVGCTNGGMGEKN